VEFRRKNPLVQKTRIVKFRSGHYPRSWVGNVVALGNSGGFVEPLEATALVRDQQCVPCAGRGAGG
jgi:tryptophan halogenase